MKSLEGYIIESEIENLNEGLLGKLKSWFKNIYKTQEKLIKDNKPVSIKVEIQNIKGPNKPCKITDIPNEELEIINDSKVGFPITADILKNKNKYLVDENKKEYDVKVNRFYYVDGKNTYAIGYSMYDASIQKIEGYANVLDLDVVSNVENFSEVQKFLMEKLEEDIKKLGKSGIIYDVKHPRLKAIFIKQGFKTSNENKNWLVKQIN